MKRLLFAFFALCVGLSSARAATEWLKDPPFSSDGAMSEAEQAHFQKAFSDSIEGDIPPGWIGKRIRFSIAGSHNHPFPIPIFFMTHVPGPLTGWNWALLTPSEYDLLVDFARKQRCVSATSQGKFAEQGGNFLEIEEFEKGGDRRLVCGLFPRDASVLLEGILKNPAMVRDPRIAEALGEMRGELGGIIKMNDEFEARQRTH